jgi:asparagine synthase (glutamine-hydrolysing)
MMGPARRGPDRYTEYRGLTHHLCFHRLAIHDMSPVGDQPFDMTDKDGVRQLLMCNGEIYNYKEIQDSYGFDLESKSDCEIIAHLLKEHNYNMAKVLNVIQGEFAIVVMLQYPNGKYRVLAARDPFGVRPLYYGSTDKGYVFSSTLSGIVGLDPTAIGDHLPPGTFLDIFNETSVLHGYYDIRNRVESLPSNTSLHAMYKKVTDALINSVKRRLDSERDLGFLLSGGLDSSLVVAIAVKILGYQRPRTFSIGMKHGKDLEYAQKVAKYLNTDHTEVHFTPSEGTHAVHDVIQTLETYDITTIRASVGQYLLAKHISEKTKVKVILNGDGADEAECGYLYFYYAPSAEDAHKESVRLLRDIYMYDGLRVDRTLSGHGLEARVPFLDTEFVEAYLSIPADLRAPKVGSQTEKQFLRDAFHALYPDILPYDVLYRKKEAFSDGVSDTKESWFAILQEWADNIVSDKEMEVIPPRISHLRPSTKESYLYRDIFEGFFPDHSHVLQYYWLPKWTNATDPSARTLDIYEN